MSSFPWLSLIVAAPLVAAVMMLFIPAASRGTVRVVAVASTLVSLALFLLLRGPLGAVAANAVAVSATFLANTWANARITQRVARPHPATGRAPEPALVIGVGGDPLRGPAGPGDVEGVGVVGLEANRLLVMENRLGLPTGDAREQHAKVIMCFRVIGLETDGLLIMGQLLGLTSGDRREQDAQIIVGLRVIRSEFERG